MKQTEKYRNTAERLASGKLTKLLVIAATLPLLFIACLQLLPSGSLWQDWFRTEQEYQDIVRSLRTEPTPAAAGRLCAVSREWLDRYPASPSAWLSMAAAQAALGNREAAIRAVQRATQLAPRLAPVQMQAGNLLLEWEEAAAALAAFRTAQSLVPDYDEAIAHTCLRAGITVPALQRAGLLGLPRARQALLRLLARQENATGLLDAVALSLPADWNPALAGQVQTALLRHGNLTAARQLTLSKVPATLLQNEGFEHDAAPGPFDWADHFPPGAVTRVSGNARDGQYALQFTATPEGSARVSQQTVLAPGWYRVQAYFQTSFLHGAEGMLLSVSGKGLRAQAEARGGVPGWQFVTVPFRVTGPESLVRVELAYRAFPRWDGGTPPVALADDVSLVPTARQ